MNIKFINDRGKELSGKIDGEGDKAIVLCSHFTGNKNVKHLYRLAKELALKGFKVLRFDYSDCLGKSEGKCEDMKVTHQVLDTISAINYMKKEGAKKIGLMGHSLGGLTAIATAAQEDVNALVVAAAPANLKWDTLFKEKYNEWKEKRHIHFPSWKGDIKIDFGFYTDLSRYDASKIIQRINCPVLIIQPEKDELISRDNATSLFENANEPKELQIVKDSDHMFSQKEWEEEMIRLTASWFEQWLINKK